VGFEHSIPSIKRLQTYTLDRTATGIDIVMLDCINYHYVIKSINRTGCLLSRHMTMIFPVISCWRETKSVMREGHKVTS